MLLLVWRRRRRSALFGRAAAAPVNVVVTTIAARLVLLFASSLFPSSDPLPLRLDEGDALVVASSGEGKGARREAAAVAAARRGLGNPHRCRERSLR